MVKVDLAMVPIQVHAVGEEIYLQIVKWKDYTVSLISAGAPYLQNSVRASFAVVGLNLAFFEFALRICRLVHKRVPYQSLSDPNKLAWRLVLASVFVITVGGANHAFRKMLQLPLPVWQIAGIGILTDVVWLIVRTSIEGTE